MGAGTEELLALITWTFMEALFAKLLKGIMALWEDVAADTKKVRKDETDLSNQVGMLKTCGNARQEELESHRGGAGGALRAESRPATPHGVFGD
ncbi:hypothetical protein NDU88_005883 [Pleurodeles waltl]|uniref:Uncharacterized protein n=1 Tax=Pleurodeles waltl TaxID=8319 RepID=A0AAV7MY04_PLEWA|nr:hypothetical protein NDU88_005883 [Pleurodeles waltl]